LALTRRGLMYGVSALGLISVFRGAAASGLPTQAADQDMFLDVSRKLTGFSDLNPEISARMLADFLVVEPDYLSKIRRLAVLVTAGGSPEDILGRADDATRPALHQLVSAWYMGSIGNYVNAPMVSYYDSLMYRPTADALPVPTYCFGTPGWWAETPPALGVPVSAPLPATPPAPPPAAVESQPPAQTHVLPTKPVNQGHKK